MNQLSSSEKQALDNLGRMQQMKINTRLTALQCAQTLMSTPGFANKYDGGREPNAACSIDHVCLLAMAQDIEAYILGTIEEETTKALDEAKAKMNAPRIVRP